VLEPVTARVRRQKDSDCDNGQLDEDVVTVDGTGGGPLLLLRGFPHIEAGPVAAMKVAWICRLEGGIDRSLRMQLKEFCDSV
jgi:hypothetical protein